MTDLERLSKDNQMLNSLIRKASVWKERELELLAVLPDHLRQRCRAAPVGANGMLTLFAADSSAAARLRLLLPGLLKDWRRDYADIVAVEVKIRPATVAVERQKQARLSRFAAKNCLESAERLEQYPNLAAAFRRLVEQAERE